MAVERSSQSVMRLMVSEPITRMRELPVATSPAPTARAYTKPEQAALRSKAPPRTSSSSCTWADEPGNVWSGVEVASTSTSMSAPVSPAPARAAAPASAASPAVVPPMRRSRIPVRSTIQLSDVSSVAARS